jgi:heat-inducible transcriptional repressor
MEEESEEPDDAKDRFARALEVRITSQSQSDRAIRGAVDGLVEMTGNLGFATIGDHLYISGIGNLFSQPEFSTASAARSVAALLDNLEPWLRETAPGDPLNVFIGSENTIGRSTGASLVVSRFRSPYSDKSYIGSLGSTRQPYGRVMSLVRRAGLMLEEIL